MSEAKAFSKALIKARRLRGLGLEAKIIHKADKKKYEVKLDKKVISVHSW